MPEFLLSLFSKLGFEPPPQKDFSISRIIDSPAFWTPIIILFCLLITSTVSYRAIKGLIEDNAKVVHSQQVLEKTLAMTASLYAAESKQRGFILAGNNLFLDECNDALQQVDQLLKELLQLTITNPSQYTQVRELNLLVKDRVNMMEAVITEYQLKGQDLGRGQFVDAGGLQKMTQVMSLAEDIESKEKNLLDKWSASSALSRSYALKSFIVGGLFTITLVFFSFYLIINDLRQRKQLNQELENARDRLSEKVKERTRELEQSNRELKEFAFIASHDLQEPLRKIQVFGDRLRQKSADTLNEASLDYLARMQSAAKRMQRLINDLLAFSRVSNNPCELTSQDLNITLKEVISDLETAIEQYNGRVYVQTLPTVRADPTQMRQLFQNIISNALKFHRAEVPPEVNVNWSNAEDFQHLDSLRDHPEFYEIAISDNGIGIDQAFIEKIFIPFQRLHGKSEYEGTGIGLAVCRKIIEHHGGQIKVLNSPSGAGTVFIIYLPV